VSAELVSLQAAAQQDLWGVSGRGCAYKPLEIPGQYPHPNGLSALHSTPSFFSASGFRLENSEKAQNPIDVFEDD